MSDNSKIVVALLAGVAVGAVVGILFAPEKGSKTRDRLSDALEDLGKSIKNFASQELDDWDDKKEQISEKVKSNVKKAKDLLNDHGKTAGA